MFRAASEMPIKVFSFWLGSHYPTTESNQSFDILPLLPSLYPLPSTDLGETCHLFRKFTCIITLKSRKSLIFVASKTIDINSSKHSVKFILFPKVEAKWLGEAGERLSPHLAYKQEKLTFQLCPSSIACRLTLRT